MDKNADFVREAVLKADFDALRMCLFQITGDEEYLAARSDSPAYDPLRVKRDDQADHVRPDEQVERVQRAALELLTGPGDLAAPPPSDAALRRMLESIADQPLSEEEFQLHREELAIDPVPREVNWSGPRPDRADEFHVAIVGAGFSGIAAAIHLERLGISYTILERRHEIGGTWSINTYPDARVDTTSLSYQFSFEKNYPWSEYFARQSEVRGYLEHVAKKYGVLDRVQFESDVVEADYDQGTGTWTVHVAGPDGETTSVRANFVISASGLFSTPKRIDYPGIDDFAGELVHTTEWHDGIALEGRHVAVIGNGSTGVQLLSRLAAEADRVSVFQRSPQWIAPRERYGEPIEEHTRWLLDHLPYYWNWFCYVNIRPGLTAGAVQEVDPEWQAAGGLISEANDQMRRGLTTYIETQLEGRQDLIERLVPAHPPMARRLIVDNNWYRTLLRDNVELVTDRIESFTADGIRAEDGTVRPIDVVVAATGFSVEKYVWPAQYRGEDGSLEEAWTPAGPRAYLGMTVPGFPNLFIMYGPNGQNRVGSLISTIECWARYIATCLVEVIEGGHHTIMVTQQACETYNAAMDEATTNLVWLDPLSIEKNYYVDKYGRQSVGVPWSAARYTALLAQPDFDAFRIA